MRIPKNKQGACQIGKNNRLQRNFINRTKLYINETIEFNLLVARTTPVRCMQ